MANAFDPTKDRWPPIYDADDLKATIEKIASNPHLLFANFYVNGAHINSDERCQGDIVAFDSSIPCIDESGEPVALDAETSFWIVLGNSCDLDRPVADVAWTLVIPIRIYPGAVTPEKIKALKNYDYARGFYVPPWSDDCKGNMFLADFLRPVSVHRNALITAPVVARMDYCGWMLFHCCVVRFLARGDGRFD